MSSLTPRERVLYTINHKTPDKVPLILGVGIITGIKMQAYRRLKSFLGMNNDESFLYDWPGLSIAEPEEFVLQQLGSDGRGVLDRLPQKVYEANRERKKGTPWYDDWGVGKPNGFPSIHPLNGVDEIEKIETYGNWPNMNDPTRFEHIREKVTKLAEEKQFAIFGAPELIFPFERAIQLQGMETFLINMSANKEFARTLLEKILSLCKVHMRNFIDATDGKMDVLVIGDDLGTQEGLLISPKMYREILKPIHANYIQFLKQHTDAKIFFHSDGDVTTILDDLIEIGVDILNPIQTSAGRMANLHQLKKRYGKQICFCGAIDTQHILPFSSPKEVYAEVKRVIGHLAPGGGYMVSSVHSIQKEVPPENVVAMCQATKDFGSYPIVC